MYNVYTNISKLEISWLCCRKGDTFQGLKLGSCLTLENELSKETHVLTKQEILLGKGKGTQENFFAMWLANFMVMGCL